MDFKEELKIRANYAEEIIKKYMPEEVGYQKTIMEAMNYSLSSGGKRLRPVLTPVSYTHLTLPTTSRV